MDPQQPNAGHITPPHLTPLEHAVASKLQEHSDQQHLKLLSIFYFVFAGLQALGVCGGLFYVVLGAFFTASPPPQKANEPPPEFMATLFFGIGGCIFVLCLVWALISLYGGLCLLRQRNRGFCMFAAGLNCLSVPLGTVLGVFTFLVLARPSVRAMFDQNQVSSSA